MAVLWDLCGSSRSLNPHLGWRPFSPSKPLSLGPGLGFWAVPSSRGLLTGTQTTSFSLPDAPQTRTQVVIYLPLPTNPAPLTGRRQTRQVWSTYRRCSWPRELWATPTELYWLPWLHTVLPELWLRREVVWMPHTRPFKPLTPRLIWSGSCCSERTWMCPSLDGCLRQLTLFLAGKWSPGGPEASSPFSR